jgi:hypothetical protein
MYPRAYRGFYQAMSTRVAKQAERDISEALQRFLSG